MVYFHRVPETWFLEAVVLAMPALIYTKRKHLPLRKHLRKPPFDLLKISQSFVRDMHRDS
jgi:hypothetical protein